MYIYFLRHAETEATKAGEIQGGADGKRNIATAEGLKKVQENATGLLVANYLEGANPCNVYLYSGEQMRCVQTSMALFEVLKNNNLILEENVILDSRLNGRSYGELEGLPESRVKSLDYIVKHPRHTISYAMALIGLDNASRIEPKSRYAYKVFSFIYGLYQRHGWNEDDVVIVSSTSDVYRVMQRDKELQNMCYQGLHPELPSISKDDKIGVGEFRIVEINQVKDIKNPKKLIEANEEYYISKS